MTRKRLILLIVVEAILVIIIKNLPLSNFPQTIALLTVWVVATFVFTRIISINTKVGAKRK